jgi:hypothetical protein
MRVYVKGSPSGVDQVHPFGAEILRKEFRVAGIAPEPPNEDNPRSGGVPSHRANRRRRVMGRPAQKLMGHAVARPGSSAHLPREVSQDGNPIRTGEKPGGGRKVGCTEMVLCRGEQGCYRAGAVQGGECCAKPFGAQPSGASPVAEVWAPPVPSVPPAALVDASDHCPGADAGDDARSTQRSGVHYHSVLRQDDRRMRPDPAYGSCEDLDFLRARDRRRADDKGVDSLRCRAASAQDHQSPHSHDGRGQSRARARPASDMWGQARVGRLKDGTLMGEPTPRARLADVDDQGRTAREVRI